MKHNQQNCRCDLIEIKAPAPLFIEITVNQESKSMTAFPPDIVLENVPRYTSYPTAPHFHSGVSHGQFDSWLRVIKPGQNVSLYIHIPYCDQLCWFCACTTKHTQRYDAVASFLSYLRREIETVGRIVKDKAKIGAVHFGGGSPTMLHPDDLRALKTALGCAFDIQPDTDISVEIDPRDMDDARFQALASMGMTRASLGIQDFDETVQKAINRHQSFELTRAVIDGVRIHGVKSVNVDLLYGLPFQTVDSVRSTIAQTLNLKPDRIALFGYAHVPWLKKHQRMIKDEWLPDAGARFAQSSAAREMILAAGYEEIGLDHFALPEDSLSLVSVTGKLRRNFQGYTDDPYTTLIGLGPSAISQFPQGYVQNTPTTAAYQRAIAEIGLASTRGIILSEDDRIRGWIIEQLMCNFGFSLWELLGNFGAAARAIAAEAETMAAMHVNGLFEWRDEGFRVTPMGKPLVRTIAARFDKYLTTGTAQHSSAI